uniref:Fibroblast activation protein, alpha n=1 Tax=Nothobranchius furzeri TaxID=105023 RepID=A0A8C6PRE3_NOTFU
MGCNRLVWGLVGAAVVITLITVPAVYYSKSGASKRPFTLQDYFNTTIRKRSYNLHWISDVEYLHKTSDGHIYLHNAETKVESLYLSNSTFAKVDATDYWLSSDFNYVAFESNYTKNWRHSYTASYSIYDREKSTFVTSVSLPPAVQYFTFGPTGSQFAYVSDFNVYFKSSVDAQVVQITRNGKMNEILNGIPDWVYEEEVFASAGAIWWSKTGKFLAYAEFNDTEVHKVEYIWYGSEPYPQTVEVPYAKIWSVTFCSYVWHVEQLLRSWVLEIMSTFNNLVMVDMTWASDERVAVQWLTRKQNHLVVQIYDFDGGSWKEKQVDDASLYTPLPLFFAEDNLSFYKIMSDSKGYKHIHLVKNGVATPISSGEWEVIYISKLTKDAIYFVSNQYKGVPVKRNLYRVMIGGSSSAPQCLTCDLHEDRCQYNSAYLSVDASFYRMDCYGPGLPLYTLMDNRGSGAGTFFKFSVLLIYLWYEMMLPPNFQKSKKYPLFIDVYGGPCSQSVNYQFKLNWGTYLSSSLGIIVASFDGRGSGYQGDEILHAIYKRLGTFEVEDQIAAVRKFIDMGFIDKDRIAIWGWSYGGYVSSMALGAGTGLFKCGIAVAPVANWEYYDAIYTERYMGRPTENSDAYKNSTVTSRAKNFKKVSYLLVHGTADDNVHFQQAAQISKALVDEQVDFEAMWYTDKDHSLGGSAYPHLYTLMSNFLQKCLLNPK